MGPNYLELELICPNYLELVLICPKYLELELICSNYLELVLICPNDLELELICPKYLELELICPRNGTAVQKGFQVRIICIVPRRVACATQRYFGQREVHSVPLYRTSTRISTSFGTMGVYCTSFLPKYSTVVPLLGGNIVLQYLFLVKVLLIDRAPLSVR